MSGGLTLEEHRIERANAEKLFAASRSPDVESAQWEACVKRARTEVQSALDATNFLRDIPAGLAKSGRHARVLRFLMGPPFSQDQFRLICPSWPKQTEKSGQPVPSEAAHLFRDAFRARADPTRTGSIDEDEGFKLAMESTALLMAVQEFETERRMEAAKLQEHSVSGLLERHGFRRAYLGKVDQPGSLGERHYAVATKFATGDGSSHEVDLAVGLPRKVILAIECKVSNDKTNSVKRVNDVLKKAAAWSKQWGRFVTTGALLQGVFSEKEPQRLIDNGVELFWSHRLDLLEAWVLVRSDSGA